MIAKAITIKSRGGRLGRCVAKAAELTPGGLSGVLHSELSASQGALTGGQESAEGIVGQGCLKARTVMSDEYQRRF